jgi:hypothetical protein
MIQEQSVAQAKVTAESNTVTQEMMTQILMRLKSVPPGYMTQPAQEKADTAMAPPPTLKRQYEQVSIEGHDDSRDGIHPGMDKNMDTEFTIQIIRPGVEMTAESHIVTGNLTLAMLKDTLIDDMRNTYEFVKSYYSGQQEERDGDQHTMQDMSMQEGSTIQVYFLGPEGPIIN